MCDGCAKKHGQSRLLYGLLMIAGAIFLALIIIPPLVVKIQENANMSPGDVLLFILMMFGIGAFLLLAVSGIQYIAQSGKDNAALAADLACIISKSGEKDEGVVVGAKPPAPDYFYNRLSDSSPPERTDAAKSLLRYYRESSLPYFFKALRSKKEEAVDAALVALGRELPQTDLAPDPALLAESFSACLPALNNLLVNRKLGAGARYLDAPMECALRLIERHGDASSLPALRSLLLRVLYRRHLNGYLREAAVAPNHKDRCDNNGWDDQVRGAIDTVAARCGLSTKDFYPPTGPLGNSAQSAARLQRPQRLYENGGGTISDFANKLMWQKEDDGQQRNHSSAIAYCAQLRLGGHANWRLPTSEELQTIADMGTPTNTHSLFINAKKERYWTKSEFGFVLDGSYLGKKIAYTVDFVDGGETTYDKTESFFVRAVRVMAPEELPQERFCKLLRQNIEIRPLTGYATCMRSLPVADACQQHNCVYHNAMSMAVFLRKSMFDPKASTKEIWAALGAKDYCGK